MFNKKIDSKELAELRKRNELINEHKLISEALEIQKQLYIRSLLLKYKYDVNKDYEIDFKSGIIKEIKK